MSTHPEEQALQLNESKSTAKSKCIQMKLVFIYEEVLELWEDTPEMQVEREGE